MNKTKLIDLDNGNKIYQLDKGFKLSTDTVELSHFINIDNPSKVLEIGTGNGIIPILLNKNNIEEFDAVDIQKENIEIAEKNFKLNNLSDKFRLINSDIRKYKKSNYYDIIISNPPFMTVDGKPVNKDINKYISRHEYYLNLEEFISNSKRLLKPVGKIFFVHRLHRLEEIIVMLNKYNFSLSKIRFLTKNCNYINIVLFEAYKGKNTKLKIEHKEV